jgi:hypothetical protein
VAAVTTAETRAVEADPVVKSAARVETATRAECTARVAPETDGPVGGRFAADGVTPKAAAVTLEADAVARRVSAKATAASGVSAKATAAASGVSTAAAMPTAAMSTAAGVSTPTRMPAATSASQGRGRGERDRGKADEGKNLGRISHEGHASFAP